jgi:hypothetical protein
MHYHFTSRAIYHHTAIKGNQLYTRFYGHTHIQRLLDMVPVAEGKTM